MKISFSRLAGVVLTILMAASYQQSKAQDAVVSYQTFYDELSPYGQWVDDPEYGNVWIPNEEPGYRPYATNGHWAMTEYGNMWVSDAPYGWATYHYGRWTYNSYYGWVWIPGHEWAPAWVSWRSGGGYYGWAPMGPGYTVGMNYNYPDNYWVFVGPEYLYQPNVYSYYQPRYTRRYIRQTTYINETYVDNTYRTTYYYGPRRDVIERETRRPVQVYQVSNGRAPGRSSVNGGVVQVYRPSVNHETRQTARPANSIRGSQPVGRPQEFTRQQLNRQPEFRQVQQGRSNAGSPSVQPRQENGRQPGNQFDNRGREPRMESPTRNDRQQSAQPGNPQNGRPARQRVFEPSENRPQQEQRQQQQPSNGRQQREPMFQQQPSNNRPQQPQNNQPQQREQRFQSQPQGQPQRPTMQAAPQQPSRQQPATKEENKGGLRSSRSR